jgi:histidinol-phosphate/aromatic aminotransferase/cobyric acid decarboxylase-like protein
VAEIDSDANLRTGELGRALVPESLDALREVVCCAQQTVREALERAFGDANLSPSPQPPLRLALAKRHGVDPSQVLVTAGSTEVIDAVIRTFARAGSEVVIPDPSWPVFRRRPDVAQAKRMLLDDCAVAVRFVGAVGA